MTSYLTSNRDLGPNTFTYHALSSIERFHERIAHDTRVALASSVDGRTHVMDGKAFVTGPRIDVDCVVLHIYIIIYHDIDTLQSSSILGALDT